MSRNAVERALGKEMLVNGAITIAIPPWCSYRTPFKISPPCFQTLISSSGTGTVGLCCVVVWCVVLLCVVLLSPNMCRDNPPDDIWEQTRESNLANDKMVSSLLASAFPRIKVYPVSSRSESESLCLRDSIDSLSFTIDIRQSRFVPLRSICPSPKEPMADGPDFILLVSLATH